MLASKLGSYHIDKLHRLLVNILGHFWTRVDQGSRVVAFTGLRKLSNTHSKEANYRVERLRMQPMNLSEKSRMMDKRQQETAGQETRDRDKRPVEGSGVVAFSGLKLY